MEDIMSKKSNINYKYLRRRQSWFRRNIPTVIIAVVAVLLIAAAVVVGVIISKNIKKDNNKSDAAAVVETEEETTTEVNWITDTEAETAATETASLMEEVTTNAKTLGNSKPYFIMVNRAANCVTVYGIDTNGEYTIPVIAFACSCGREGHETPLIENYVTSDKYPWRLMVDNQDVNINLKEINFKYHFLFITYLFFFITYINHFLIIILNFIIIIKKI